MENEKTVFAAPFLRSKETTAVIMRDVCIALLPAALFGIFRYGFRAFLLVLLSVTACVVTEHIIKRIRKAKNGGYEGSAIVTGLIFGMMLPAEAPYWLPVAGGVAAMVFGKWLWGGLGKNLWNPAALTKGVIFLLAAFGIKEVAVEIGMPEQTEDLLDLFLGYGKGNIGELSSFLLLLGGLYLVLCRVISLWVPVLYLLAFSLVVLGLGGAGLSPEYLGEQICTGGVLLGAFFMINDTTASPLTRSGRVLFAIVTGALTGVFRGIGITGPAVVCGVLCGNLLVPLLDKITFPRSFGKGKKARR